jgi:tetratricopeptide (TPR) repeat protein
MELEYENTKPSTHRRHFWLQLTLLIGFIFCLILGVGALAALFILQTEETTAPPLSPVAAFPIEGITPQHALVQLAGDPPLALAYQAIQAGELDLAYAITYFSTELSDSDRLSLYLQIGRRFLAAERIEQGTRAYLNARATIVLGPSLTFLERTQALLQIADDFFKVGALPEALDAAIQAKRLAEQTPDILPAQRSQIFEALRPLSRQLGSSAFEGETDAAARNPYLAPPGVLLVSQWSTLAEPLAVDPQVLESISLRQQAARSLADRIAFTGGVDVDPERQTLATALLNEDQARNAAFQRTLASGINLGQQFTLLQEHRHWAALKLRIATRAFGISILPEWEANVTHFQQELAAANNNLLVVVEAITAAKSDPIAQAMLRVETQMWVAQQTETGLVADRTLVDLSDQIRFLQSQLIQLGAPLALPVALEPTVSEAGALPPGFHVLPFNALQ